MSRTGYPYPSDLSNAEWALLEPLLASSERRRARPPKWSARRIADAGFYLLRSGGMLEEKPRGFQVLPRRWVIERTFARLGQVRRLAKDYERLPETAVAMVYAAMSRLMLRRLARLA